MLQGTKVGDYIVIVSSLIAGNSIWLRKQLNHHPINSFFHLSNLLLYMSIREAAQSVDEHRVLTLEQEALEDPPQVRLQTIRRVKTFWGPKKPKKCQRHILAKKPFDSIPYDIGGVFLKSRRGGWAFGP